MTTIRDRLFSEQEWHRLVGVLGLTARQQEVLTTVINGFSDKQLAERLGVEVTTVRTHLRRMYAKFGVNDRTELVVHCFLKFRQEVSSD